MIVQKWRESDLSAIQEKIGYVFQNRGLLEEALTHSSFANESGSSLFNERLEFLGDAVLELVTSEKLYAEHNSLNEGQLTLLRSKLVRKDSLVEWAKSVNLPPLIRVGKSLARSGATDSMSADAAEAIFGAIFLDGGFDRAKEVIVVFLKKRERDVSSDEKDPKTELQQLIQSQGHGVPYYRTIERRGPGHALKFRVQVTLDDMVLAEAWGNSIKDAEFHAAEVALAKIGTQ